MYTLQNATLPKKDVSTSVLKEISETFRTTFHDNTHKFWKDIGVMIRVSTTKIDN